MMSQITTPAVRGVPAFFVRSWLVDSPVMLGGLLAVLGAIDLLLALANLGLGDPLAMLVNLVLGVVEVAAAAVLLGLWRTDAMTLDRVSTACMCAMWLTGAWAAITFIGMFGIQAIFGAVLAIAFMMALGSASAVIKTRSMSTY